MVLAPAQFQASVYSRLLTPQFPLEFTLKANRVSVAAAFALAAATLAPLSTAQTLTESGGVLGASADYTLQGDPGEFWILIPSLTPGPTPLSLLNPGDTRVLSVGFDQYPLWSAGFLNGSGAGAQSYGLPNDPSLQGLGVYAQFVTYPGNPFKVDDISNPTAMVLGASGTSTTTIAPPTQAWVGHTMTVQNDGRVLRAGGTFSGGTGTNATNSLETWDPQTGTWTTVSGTMTQVRAAHSATLLQDGRVLIVGGGNSSNIITASCDLYDPLTGAVTATDSMSEARTQHTATLLQDGRVLVVGGTNNFDFDDPLAALAAVSKTAEVYDPSSNLWSNVGSLPNSRAVHAASLLNNGLVLVTGGIEVAFVFGIPVPSISDDARLFNPTSNSFQNAGNFSGGRLAHPQVTLSNGNVMVAGGSDGDLLSQTFSPLTDVWIYNTSGDSWSQVASLSRPRVYGQLVEVAGDVLLLQGLETIDLATLTGIPVLDVERTTVTGGAWSVVGLAITGHPLSLAASVGDGTRVMTLGAGVNGTTDVELFVR
ncbi:MAG: hypothetical protein ACI8QS_000346 [Planctomycetota bacterium]|jgi:hypothetical protein